MESGEFLSYLSHPTNVGADSLKKLERMVREYPYCQSAQLLYTFNLYLQQHPAYPAQLKKAAAFASDRKRLKALIDQYQPVIATVAPETKRHPVVPEPKRHLVAREKQTDRVIPPPPSPPPPPPPPPRQ